MEYIQYLVFAYRSTGRVILSFGEVTFRSRHVPRLSLRDRATVGRSVCVKMILSQVQYQNDRISWALQRSPMRFNFSPSSFERKTVICDRLVPATRAGTCTGTSVKRPFDWGHGRSHARAWVRFDWQNELGRVAFRRLGLDKCDNTSASRWRILIGISISITGRRLGSRGRT